MKLMIMIINDEDAEPLTQAFTAENFRLTRIASTGGFLRRGVATMLLGVEDSQVDAAIAIAHKSIPHRENEKRATLFVVPVENFEQV
ncbi:MAG: cyclic-di-AMP receptor [Anaerolineales bacterium]